MTGPGTGPVFSGGTMQITGAGVSSALPVFLGPGGGTVDTQANSATFSGIISGPGSLTKIGTGTLTSPATAAIPGRPRWAAARLS